MSAKTPIRGVFDSGTATGLAEFQSGEFIALTHGGLGASLSIGSAGQVLKVNSGASALEFGNVEAIVNIDGATDLESATLAVGDKILVSDGGTEGRALLSQVDTLFSGTTKTLTNKTISGSSNTLSNIGNSSLSNSSVNFGGVTVALGASDTTPAFDLSDATSYPTSSLTGTITNAQLAGSIANDKLSNSSVNFGGITVALGASDTTPAFDLTDATNYPTSSLTGTITNAQLAGSISNDKLAGSIANSKLANPSFTLVDTSSTSTTVSLGETLKIQGTSNEVEASVSGDTLTIGLPNNVTISGNLTVSGTTTEVSSTTINVADPLLSMATNNNSADAVDIGFYGLYDTSGSQDLYAGLFRDASDSGKFKLFKDNQAEPTTTVNTSGTGYSVATLVANLEGNVTGNVTGNTSGSSGSTTGNAATATALQTARNINGVSFDGTANIDIGSVTSGSTSITTNLGARTFETESLDTPVGFITINIGGTNYKLPYYSA